LTSDVGPGTPGISSKGFFMATIFELKQQQKHALDKAENIIRTAETEGRDMTKAEQLDYDTSMAAYSAITPQVREFEARNTIRKMMGPNGMILTDGGRRISTPGQLVLSEDYREAFFDYVRTNGQNVGAAMYEGSNPAGGYTVPVTVEGNVVPLAPTDRGIREIATVISTAMDIKIPRATTISTAAAKAEGTGSGANLFTESTPLLDQFTLSAFMAGLTHTVSWELAQDVPSFQAFAVGDMLLAQSIFEENWFVNGTGTGQAQGIKGNVGTGTGNVVVAGTDNYASELLDATFDVMGTLKTAYHPGASFLMSRATSIVLRKAQKQANLFEPVFTRSAGKDYLHGYPVTYSTAVDGVTAGGTPIYFGDFKQGYVIGDRGGSGINIKILDQPKATEGLVILLAYRRTDGRVRRSEAIQAIALHS
jgi:HK97 family phage major capsid protein